MRSRNRPHPKSRFHAQRRNSRLRFLFRERNAAAQERLAELTARFTSFFLFVIRKRGLGYRSAGELKRVASALRLHELPHILRHVAVTLHPCIASM